MKGKFLTQHPQKGKRGVHIRRGKYELIKENILKQLTERGEMTFAELTRILTEELQGKFDGSVPWYVTTVKLDLEARGLIVRIPKSSPQRLRLVEARSSS